MAKHKTLARNIQIKKTPRLFRARVKMIEKIKPNTKKELRRKFNKQKLRAGLTERKNCDILMV